MTHDPFQTYAMLSANPGMASALGLNPASLNPFAGGISPYIQQQGQPGIPGYSGVIPHPLQQLQQLQQLQLAALVASQTVNPYGLTSPFAAGWQNPMSSFGLQQNPFHSQGLQNPLWNPTLAQHYPSQYPQASYGVSPFGPIGVPFGQVGQAGYPLGPQTWIGPQSHAGSSGGQTHPMFSPWGSRGFPGHGISPWTGF